MEGMKSEIAFGDEKVKKSFGKLNRIKEKQFYEQLVKAFENLKENAFCGIQIPKNLIPKEYIRKFGNLSNLQRYNLPDAWRLMYTIKNEGVIVLSVILDWLDHKEYEKRFKY